MPRSASSFWAKLSISRTQRTTHTPRYYIYTNIGVYEERVSLVFYQRCVWILLWLGQRGNTQLQGMIEHSYVWVKGHLTIQLSVGSGILHSLLVHLYTNHPSWWQSLHPSIHPPYIQWVREIKEMIGIGIRCVIFDFTQALLYFLSYNSFILHAVVKTLTSLESLQLSDSDDMHHYNYHVP